MSLNAEQRARKRRMLDCYHTQRMVLRLFSTDKEQFRAAPHYDFLAAPHEGLLHYETLGWSIDGTLWRERAREALEVLRCCRA
jgi:hypothetical protein